MLIQKQNEEINALEDWFRLAPPQGGKKHWVDGRSAKETAKAWLAGLPQEIQALLAQHSDFRNVAFDTVEPEALIPFDKHGNPRHADLAILAHDEYGEIAITVEAKADEAFDFLVSSKFSQALEYAIANPRSQAVDRIHDLALSLFSKGLKGEAKVTSLRYQLLTSVAGTLAFATEHGIDRAVLIIHEFITSETSERKLQRNLVDLTKFYRRITHQKDTQIASGELYGPIPVPGKPLFESGIEFYIGKAVRHIGTPMP